MHLYQKCSFKSCTALWHGDQTTKSLQCSMNLPQHALQQQQQQQQQHASES